MNAKLSLQYRQNQREERERKEMAMIQVVILAVGLFAFGDSAPVPSYDKTYMIKGVLRLPYAEIEEPFVAYFDTPNKRSRVDFYGGLYKNFQRAAGSPGYKYGTHQEIVYYSDQKVLNELRCFEMNGTSDAPTTLVTYLPDLTGFKFIGTKSMSGISANVYQMKLVVGKKISTYTLYTNASSNAPMQYEMMGYDSLLGSHYDKYYVDYINFTSPHTFSDSDFAIPSGITPCPSTGLKCGSFPGPGQTVHSVNPVPELIHRDNTHVDKAFEDFKQTHGKQYKPLEHETRKHIFRQNLRYIHSMNRAGLTYTMRINHLADFTMNELKMRNGLRHTKGEKGGAVFSMEQLRQDIPDSFDWRLRGAVTPVKDQAVCGSCWSFGTTGTIEGANFLKTGNLVRLSQQELMDCSWGYGNNACDGGEDFRSYQFIMANGGLTSEEQYGMYLGADSKCKKKEVKPVVQLKNYTMLPQGDQKALKTALFNKGPISVGIDAAHKSLSFYANGVYYEPSCKNGPDDLDHAVLAVGYGILNGQEYWLVKNSWSTYWGNDGYVLMSMKDNNCGVATAASYVDIL